MNYLQLFLSFSIFSTYLLPFSVFNSLSIALSLSLSLSYTFPLLKLCHYLMFIMFFLSMFIMFFLSMFIMFFLSMFIMFFLSMLIVVFLSFSSPFSHSRFGKQFETRKDLFQVNFPSRKGVQVSKQASQPVTLTFNIINIDTPRREPRSRCHKKC